MDSAHITADLASELQQLRAGQRVWFWASPDVQPGYPPFLVTAFDSDPGMEHLRAMAASVRKSETALETFGAGAIGEDGTLKLGSTLMRPRMLSTLSRFVHVERISHPGLERFWGTRLLALSDGRVVAEHADDGLWEGIPRPLVPGTIAHAAARLLVMRSGERAWAWLVERGPTGVPDLVVGDYVGDEDGRQFAELVGARRRRASGGWSLSGLLICYPTWIAWNTSADPTGWRSVVRALMDARDELALLRELRVVRLSSKGLEQIQRLEA